MLREFRDFIMRGNVVDLAVAIVIGVAFAAVVTSLVDNLISPLIAAVFGEPDISDMTFTINDAVFSYGAFITSVISFVLIAAAVFFLIVKPMNAMVGWRRKEIEDEPPAPSEDVLLLREIRDLLSR